MAVAETVALGLALASRADIDAAELEGLAKLRFFLGHYSEASRVEQAAPQDHQTLASSSAPCPAP
jgi:hypothetical protein